ncbi:imidazole glycerol phosphate synthase subunit HisH [Pseudomonadales bacterium]|jgi:imidazole glycerol-phosphate synthase subunit HisH|nr:imidazole glycerol phosphate synthase subunit HisH [Pseudomonadales bacterium]
MIDIAILDYGVGNVRSICAAVEKVGSTPKLTKSKDVILRAQGLIIPGVGAFKHGMDKLLENDLVDFLQDYGSSDKPILGICLGMQMLFSQSTEFGTTKGLNLIEGTVDILANPLGKSLKLPHVCWSELKKNGSYEWGSTILDGVSDGQDLYFVHSFVGKPIDEGHVLSYSEYEGVKFCSTVKKGNIYGVQYHPEKSGKEGLSIVKNFSDICKELKL